MYRTNTVDGYNDENGKKDGANKWFNIIDKLQILMMIIMMRNMVRMSVGFLVLFRFFSTEIG
jgi:hypothetical protein